MTVGALFLAAAIAVLSLASGRSALRPHSSTLLSLLFSFFFTMQTARLTKRPLIHIDENLDTNPAAKRVPLADKAVIAADKENSQVARKVVCSKQEVADR